MRMQPPPAPTIRKMAILQGPINPALAERVRTLQPAPPSQPAAAEKVAWPVEAETWWVRWGVGENMAANKEAWELCGPAKELLRARIRQVRPPRLRTIREFAEQEIFLPTGKFEGLRFSVTRNPYAGQILDLIGKKKWRRVFITGPSQSGKTLIFVIFVLYWLFEMRQTMVLGAPTAAIARDKWERDLLPMIRRTKYAALLPMQGSGSKGGEFEMITFANGVALRIMTGGGKDESRANFTAQAVAVTEVEGFDEVSEKSEETDKFTQIETRTAHYGADGQVLGECTVRSEEGRTWREIKGGTDTRIAMRCPHCRMYVTPEREHLVGWKDAKTELEAARNAAIACPGCAVMWTEEERHAAMHEAVVVHKGQRFEKMTESGAGEGQIIGEPVETETLGFRWTPANNLIKPIGEAGRKEWLAERASDPEAAERELAQYVWAMPPKLGEEKASFKAADIVSRAVPLPKGDFPPGVIGLTSGCDLGENVGHWVIVGWTRGSSGIASPHIVEYGRFDVPKSTFGLDEALKIAVREYRDTTWREYREKFKRQFSTATGSGQGPQVLLFDGGWNQEVVFPVACEGWPYTAACKGFGERQLKGGKPKNRKVLPNLSGEGYRAVKADDEKYPLFEQISDRFKSYVHAALQVPRLNDAGDGGNGGGVGGWSGFRDGAMTLYAGTSPGEHLDIARHVLAEKSKTTFMMGRGWVRVWEQVHRNNHLLDALGLAVVAGVLGKILTLSGVPGEGTGASGSGGQPTNKPVAVVSGSVKSDGREAEQERRSPEGGFNPFKRAKRY